MEIGVLSHKGMQRPVNEDRLAAPPEDLAPQVLARKGHLYVVADGMGGHKAGELASEITVRMVMQRYYADPSEDVPRSLVRAIEVANAEIHHLAQEPAYTSMGTTVVAAVALESMLTVAHVGDSRAYLVRGDGIRALTEDHTWVAEQVRNGLLLPEQADQHSQRHVVTRFLGRESKVSVDVRHVALRPGDHVLLCSDGLWEQVKPGELQTLVQGYPPQEAAEQLVELANQRGGPDNITAVIIRPTIASASSTELQRAEYPPGSLARLLARFGALPAPSRLLLVTGALAAGFLGCASIIAYWLSKPLPSAPPVVVAPVVYVVQEGDTREGIAAFFQVMTETLPADPQVGQQIAITPGGYGVFFSGQVLSADLGDNVAMLEVASRFQRYTVRCELRVEGAITAFDAAPKKGDTVSVFGYPEEGGDAVRAAVVDVWQKAAWDTWYFRQSDSPVWIYTSFYRHLISPPQDEAELEGRPALVRGRWSPTEEAARLIRADEGLFILDGDVYSLWMSQKEGQPLTVDLTPVQGPSRTAAADKTEPKAAAATTTMSSLINTVGPEPTLTPHTDPTPQVIIHGRVRASWLWLRRDPSMSRKPKGLLRKGDEVQILCRQKGLKVHGNEWWYYIVYSGGRKGYVSAYWITLDGTVKASSILSCGQ